MNSTALPADVAAAIKTLAAYARLEDANPWAKYPPVLQVQHVAELLGLTPDAVRKRCRRHRGAADSIPMVFRDGKYIVDQVTFRRWCGYELLAAAPGGRA